MAKDIADVLQWNQLGELGGGSSFYLGWKIMILKEADVTFVGDSRLEYMRWHYVIEKAGLSPQSFKDVIRPYLDNNINVVVIDRGGVYDLYIEDDQPVIPVAPEPAQPVAESEDDYEYVYYRGAKTKVKKQALPTLTTLQNPQSDASAENDEDYTFIYYRGAKTRVKKQAIATSADNQISYRGAKVQGH